MNTSIDIFISHSSIDLPIVKALVVLIKDSLLIDPDRIRCTSLDGYRLPAGAETIDTLRTEVFNSKVFIGIISQNSLSSQFVMFELGARWGAHKSIIPLICKSTDIQLVSSPLKDLNFLSLDNESQLFQLIDDLESQLSIKKHRPSKYSESIKKLKDSISQTDKISDLRPALSTDGYLVYNDGMIKDEKTGFLWLIGGDINMNWISSKEWIENVKIDGGNWTMPTIDDLRTLYNSKYTAGIGYYKNGKHWPAKMHPVFQAIGSGSWVWSIEKENKNSAKAFNFNQNEEVILPITNTIYSTRAFALKK